LTDIGVPDVKYRVQRAVSLAGPWSDVATNTAPASGLIEFHETAPPQSVVIRVRKFFYAGLSGFTWV